MKKIKRLLSSICVLAIVFGMFAHPEIAKAATATVTFGSESYAPKANEEFYVGVYLNGDERIGSYHVELKYDKNRMEYLSGAEAGGEGIVILEGTGVKQKIKYMLRFRSKSGGKAFIKVSDAKIGTGREGNQDFFTITEKDSADINISGRDTVGKVPEENGFETEIPHVSPAILVNGKKHYLLDLNKMIPGNLQWEYELVKVNFLNQQVTFLVDQERNVYIAYLFDESENLKPYAYNPTDKMFYPCKEYTSGEMTYIYVSASACANWPEELTLDSVKKQGIVYSIDAMGKGQFSHLDEDGVLVKWDEEAAQQTLDDQNKLFRWIIIFVIIVVLGIAVIAYYSTIVKERQNEKKYKKSNKTKSMHMKHAIPVSDIDDLEQEDKEALFISKEEPVISVQDVTMRFKVSTGNASSIKEYLIQLLKRETTHRDLIALNHVSFDIYKGEVVGVIGTNGSGKSTVLRIVAGGLMPTDGQVVVDQKKVQLLSLGTGFDKELTARENVYLNGSIIGYSEEFINAHFDEIVKFAELEGFMDEKVKNFSSGMVSRLGFAIATVGENAEILILDEVLSVGDEFFRKKSLARVKELIHSGATVLMVSHSMSTIKENCSKVVWIEKGIVKMIGPTDAVCDAYQRHHYKKARR